MLFVSARRQGPVFSFCEKPTLRPVVFVSFGGDAQEELPVLVVLLLVLLEVPHALRSNTPSTMMKSADTFT